MHWIIKAGAIGAVAGYVGFKAKIELEKQGYSPEVQAAIGGAGALVIFLASVGIAGAAVEAAGEVAGI